MRPRRINREFTIIFSFYNIFNNISFSYHFNALECPFWVWLLVSGLCLVVFLQYLWIIYNVVHYARYESTENFQKAANILLSQTKLMPER